MNGTQHAALVPKCYSTLLERLQSYDPQLILGPVPQIVFDLAKTQIGGGYLDHLDRDDLVMVTFTDPIKAYLLSEVATCYWNRDAAPTPFDRWLDAAIAKEAPPAESAPAPSNVKFPPLSLKGKP